MNKYFKTLVVTVVATGLLALFGCSMVMDAITPCYIEPDAVEYTGEEAISWLPFTSLWDAERIDSKVDYTHLLNQITFARMMEDDKIKADYLKDKATAHIAGAKEFQKAVFSPEGPVGLLLPTLMGGTLGAVLIKRPGDKTKKEVELEVKNGR